VFDSGRISRYCGPCSKRPPASREELEAAGRVRENAWGVRWSDWGDPANRTLEWIRICECGAEFVTDDRRVTYCMACGVPTERVRRHRAN
jgi:hypothetical protein